MNIEIDFDVFKALTLRRSTEDISYNDVLRELLGLGPQKNPVSSALSSGHGDWVTKGVRFPTARNSALPTRVRNTTERLSLEGLLLTISVFIPLRRPPLKLLATRSMDGLFGSAACPGKSSWQMIKSSGNKRR